MQQPVLRAHPERTAWVVLWGAFAAFCLLAILVPLTVRYVLLYSTQSHPAVLQTIEGTCVVDNPATGSEKAVTKDGTESIPEGSVISLDDKSRGDLRFFDGSSVTLLPGTRVTLEKAQGPRFGSGVRPNSIWLRVVSGRIKIVTTGPSRRAGLDFALHCPVLNVDVTIQGDGVYGAEIDPASAVVFANRGSAVVAANGKSVELAAPERTSIAAGSQPADPVVDAREFVANGDFRKPLEDGWAVANDQGADLGDVPGTAVAVTDEGLPAVRFFRTGSERNHCETMIQQEIDRDLPDPVSSLEIRANLKVINQSLSGGGSLGSEFPLMIRLRYRDAYGSENEWVTGFYYENPLSNPTLGLKPIFRDTWQLYESGNLLDTLKPRPARILWLRVYASGWDYDSMIRWISVAVR